MRCSNGVRFTAEIIPVNLIQIMLAEEFEAWRAFLCPHPPALTTREVPLMSTPDIHRSAIDEDPAADRHQPALCPGVCRRHPHRLHPTAPSPPNGAGPQDQAGLREGVRLHPQSGALEDGVAILNRLGWKASTARPTWCWGWTMPHQRGQAERPVRPHATRLDGLKVPGGWQDDTFVPYDYGYFAFVYDSNKLKQPPRA